MLIHQYELFQMFGEFITKMFIKMNTITNSLLVWMFLVSWFFNMRRNQIIINLINYLKCSNGKKMGVVNLWKYNELTLSHAAIYTLQCSLVNMKIQGIEHLAVGLSNFF
jgi:hypothetical protein